MLVVWEGRIRSTCRRCCGGARNEAWLRAYRCRPRFRRREHPAISQPQSHGLVPTIDDDGFILWESNAIVRYLTAKHAAGTLWPEDLKIRAEADRWMDWHNTTFWPAIRPLFHGLVRTAPDKRDPHALEDARQKPAEALVRIVDAHLETRAYLAGDAFTMGDIVLGCGVALDGPPIERPAVPNVQWWCDVARPATAYQKIVMKPLS